MIGGIVSFFAGPFGKVAMIGIAILSFFWWLKAHDAAHSVKVKEDTRLEMGREIDERKKAEFKAREQEIAEKEKANLLKSQSLDQAIAKLNQSADKMQNEAIRLKATNAAKLAAIPGEVKSIPDPQLELEYRRALVELRMQEAQP